MSSTNNHDRVEKALGLLQQALALLQAKPERQADNAGFGSAKDAGSVKVGRLHISSQHEALLGKWTQVHCTQWVPRWAELWPPFSAVHTPGTLSDTVLACTFFEGANKGRTDVSEWVLRVHKTRLLGIKSAFHVSAIGENPWTACKILRKCGHTLDDPSSPVVGYALEALGWAIRQNDTQLPAFLKEWGLTANIHVWNAFIVAATARGNVDVMKCLKDTWNLTRQEACNVEKAVVVAARHGHVEVLKHLKTDWGLTLYDVRYWQHSALREAIKKGHTDASLFLVDWICEATITQ
jgi:hypothetical protein